MRGAESLGIVEVAFCGVLKDVHIFFGLITCHGQVVEECRAAVARSGSGDVAFIAGNEAEGLDHQRQHIAAVIFAADEQIVAGEASHRSPIDDAFAPHRMVAQEGGGKMLDGVDGTLAEHGLAVGTLHAYVESGHHVTSHGIAARNVDARFKGEVVDGE